MTEIREKGFADEAEEPASDPLPRNNPSPTVMVLFVASLILSVTNGLGLIYTVSVVDRLSEISSKVSRIDDFEDRVSRQIAALGHGIQSRIDTYDPRLAANDPRLPNLLAPPAIPASADGRIDMQTTRSADFATHDPGNATAMTPGRFTRVSRRAATANAAGFTRVVTADGKIVYRKVQATDPVNLAGN